ncbi:MAG: efflux RND transporter periplasmic adaptor subunit [Spirochaetales bacterium]|nr:efflux RND transporter periplasmic adaptor subunit [Spirochaetales bacterium]
MPKKEDSVSTMENSPKPSIVQQGKTKRIKQPGSGRQLRIAIIVLGIIAALMGGGWYFLSPREEIYILRDYESGRVTLGQFESTTQASGTVVIGREVDLPSRQEGYGDELYVDEGDYIVAGQILAKMDVPDLLEDLEDYQISLTSAQIDLEEEIINQKYEILELNKTLEDLRDDIVDAEEDVVKYEELVKVNASRESELEDARDTLEDLQGDLEDSLLDLEKTEQINILEIRDLEDQIKSYEIKIARTQAEIDDTRISSPISGEIQSIADELAVAGSYIAQNDTLITIVDRSSAVVELEVYEEYASLLTEGQEILMTVSDSAVLGTIESIGQYATSSSDGLGSTITVEVVPDQSAGYLTPGATAVSELSLGARDNVMTLPRGAYLTTGSQKYLYVIKNGVAEKVKVTYGSIEENTVEILSGVEPGDEVILSGYQNFIEYSTLEIEN